MNVLIDTEVLIDLAQFVEIAPTTTESLRQAGRLKPRDFEDAMQVAAAMACGADLIATRNHKDYAGAPIRAAAPGEVLKILTEHNQHQTLRQRGRPARDPHP